MDTRSSSTIIIASDLLDLVARLLMGVMDLH